MNIPELRRTKLATYEENIYSVLRVASDKQDNKSEGLYEDK